MLHINFLICALFVLYLCSISFTSSIRIIITKVTPPPPSPFQGRSMKKFQTSFPPSLTLVSRQSRTWTSWSSSVRLAPVWSMVSGRRRINAGQLPRVVIAMCRPVDDDLYFTSLDVFKCKHPACAVTSYVVTSLVACVLV